MDTRLKISDNLEFGRNDEGQLMIAQWREDDLVLLTSAEVDALLKFINETT